MLVAALGLALQLGVLDRAVVPPGAEVSVHAIALPQQVVVGQPVRYEFGVFIRADIRQRLRRNPEYVPPELRGLVGYDLRERDSVRRVTRNGVEYEAHRFVRELFPVAAGTLDVGEARLTYGLPSGPSFFAREESRTLRTSPLRVIASDPPERGRPPGWLGAVGDLRIALRPPSGAWRRGTPTVVTLRVEGAGHIPYLPRPALVVPWASVVPSGERVVTDTDGGTLRGSKEFDWLVTPEVEGAQALPPVEYVVYELPSGAYRTLRTTALPLRVAAAAAVASTPGPGDAESRAATARVALRLRSGRSWPAPVATCWFWALVALAPSLRLLPALGRRRSARAAAGPTLATLPATADAAARRLAFHAALTARVGGDLPWADPTAARRQLRRAGVTSATADAIVRASGRLEKACFAAGGSTGDELPTVDALRRLLRTVDREARARPAGQALRRGGAALSLLLLLPVATALGAQPQAARAFAEGLALADSAPVRAADRFFEAARVAPRDGAAWRNAAALSWAVGDTARAVVAWHAALRLSPLDAALRASLAQAGVPTLRGPAAVWPLPVAALGWGALLLWWLAWWRWGRERHRRGAGLMALVAALAMVAALWQHGRLARRGLAAVVRPTPLRDSPALTADPTGRLLTGELLPVVLDDGLWVALRSSGGREGWVDARDLLRPDGRPWRD
jgi:hypothetical protein